ncbi:MAG: radical SAM protein, partial [Zavarzinia sp.]
GLGCSVQLGLQSADPAVLAAVGRDFDPEDFGEKALLLHEAGVVYGFDLVYGLPGDDLAGFRASLDYALGLAPNHLDLFPLAVLPGTRLAETAAGLGLLHLPEPPYTVVSSAGMSAAELGRAAGLAEACRLLYVRAGAVAWFQLALDALALRPSELLADFAEWTAGRPAVPSAAKTSEQAAQGLAKDFLAEEFPRRGRPELAAAAVDLVEWFAVTDRLLALDEAAAAAGLETRFAHDPAELGRQLKAGLRDLAELAFFVPRRPALRRARLVDGGFLFDERDD